MLTYIIFLFHTPVCHYNTTTAFYHYMMSAARLVVTMLEEHHMNDQYTLNCSMETALLKEI